MTGPEDLERAILGGTPDLTREQVAENAGVSLDDARRLWRALGFPDVSGEAAFTQADAEALARVARAVRGGQLDLDTMVRLTRGVGSAMARLAEWEVGTLSEAVARAGRAGESRMDSAMQMIEEIGPSFEALLIYSWRRHLAASVARADALGGAEDVQVTEATVGFADLVSFSSLTNDLDESHIGDLVEIFESRCQDTIARRGGRVIKTLGDSVLFVANTAAEGVDIAWDIVGVIGRDERMPDVRIGMVTGPVVLRMGDVYGPAVNLASRLTNVARRNRVVTEPHTASLLPAEYERRTLPARPLRGFGEIEPVAVRPGRRS